MFTTKSDFLNDHLVTACMSTDITAFNVPLNIIHFVSYGGCSFSYAVSQLLLDLQCNHVFPLGLPAAAEAEIQQV
jgi:hypothetical protein